MLVGVLENVSTEIKKKHSNINIIKKNEKDNA